MPAFSRVRSVQVLTIDLQLLNMGAVDTYRAGQRRLVYFGTCFFGVGSVQSRQTRRPSSAVWLFASSAQAVVIVVRYVLERRRSPSASTFNVP